MSNYQVFARKYRPRKFDDILGQDHVVRTLKNAVEQDRIAQAYLFVGPRGTGKTSTARILAKALNCPGGPKADFDPDDPLCIEIAEGRSIDVLEIDGASNNSVDQIRDLRETVRYAPAVGKFKIYYIDEVHMLSTQAFNALLKTLEEPPAHVKFIFATTEAHKVLPTILSRCQRFDLRPIPAATIASHLLHVAREEGITLSQEAAQTIARGADGGMRDAQSMLDQLVAFCGNTIEEHHAVDVFGFTSAQTIGNLATLILQQNTASALSLVHAQHEGGRDLQNLLGEIVTFFRNLLVLSIDPANILPDVTPEARRMLKANIGIAPNDRLLELIDLLAMVQEKMRWAPNKKLHFEMGVVKAVQLLQQVALSDVLEFLRAASQGAEPPPLPITPRYTPQPDALPDISPVIPPVISSATTSLPARPQEPPPPSVSTTEASLFSDSDDASLTSPVISQEPPVSSFPSEPSLFSDSDDSSLTPPLFPTEDSPPQVRNQEPAPTTSASSQSKPISPQLLWSEAVDHLEKSGGGIVSDIARSVTIFSLDDGTLIGGMPHTKDFELGLLKSVFPDLCRHLNRTTGRDISLDISLREDLVDETPDIDDSDISSEDLGSPPVPNLGSDNRDSDDEPPPDDDEPASSSPAIEDEPEVEDPEIFYHDPLIEKAMTKFSGQIVHKNS